MKAHFVTFYSPGTFVAEETTKPIDEWDVAEARAMAAKITERYHAHPYGFVFTTRERRDNDLDSKEVARSGIYYLSHCKVFTLDEIKARNDPNDRILIANMEGNRWDRVVRATQGWQWTQPLHKNDVVLT